MILFALLTLAFSLLFLLAWTRLKSLEKDYKELLGHFMKVLRLIKYNAENIDQLDDDLYRVEERIDRLQAKVAGGDPPA